MNEKSLHILFRPAVLEDIALLDALAFRSKAHWGYASAQMEAWRPQLAVAPAWIDLQRVVVAVAGHVITGFVVILDQASQWKLEHLWVDPAAMGKGVGRALLDQACQLARSLGATELIIDADPNAEGFYRACGAQLVGTLAAPTEIAPSRTLPVFRLPCAAPDHRQP